MKVGQKHLLLRLPVNGTLALKVGAPVVLVRNLHNGLMNGMLGIVLELHKDAPPVINFGGRIITLEQMRFDVYDPKQKKSLAARYQYPIKLAYALTVHRAQGMTLPKVEVDSYSFFAPGQLGVAIGRCVSTDGLKVVNYNPTAARLLHPEYVYDFYFRESIEPQVDLGCCKQMYCHEQEDDEFQLDEEITVPTTKDQNEVFANLSEDCDSLQGEVIQEFIKKFQGQSFCSGNLNLDSLKQLGGKHLATVKDFLKKTPKTNDDFVQLYSKVNKFLTSDAHQERYKLIIDSPKPQKLSSKLFFFLLDKDIKSIADSVKEKQADKVERETTVTEPNTATRNKIRYIAGACINKICMRLKGMVLRRMGVTSKKGRLQRKWSYQKHKLLKTLTVSEEEITRTTDDRTSLQEINFKQNPCAPRGLLHVNDPVFEFFKDLHKQVQQKLTSSNLHLHLDDIHLMLRKILLHNNELVQKWINLFEVDIEDDEDEMFLSMLLELYGVITEHFLRVSLADAVTRFKESIPRTKKQALRSKIQALSEREGTSAKKQKLDLYASSTDTSQPSTSGLENVFHCGACNKLCLEEPEIVAQQSIACDACNKWFHYSCMKIKGTEKFLASDNATWKCTSCKKGKGKGKSSKRCK